MKTSSDVTLHPQVIEMAEGCMLDWILVGGECLLAVEGIQSRELDTRSVIVCFVFALGLLEKVRVWFTPDAHRATIV